MAKCKATGCEHNATDGSKFCLHHLDQALSGRVVPTTSPDGSHTVNHPPRGVTMEPRVEGSGPGATSHAPRDVQTRKGQTEDNWAHRSVGMRCATCMWWMEKANSPSRLGRCRKNAPTMGGFPATYSSDWCGQHKLDEAKA